MKKTAVLLFIMLWSMPVVWAQQQVINPLPAYSDLPGAVPVLSDTVVVTTSPEGFGIPEISAPRSSEVYFEKEHHTIWFKIKPEKTCTWSFRLIPDRKEDDLDFILFKQDTTRVKDAASLIPIRSNKARNNLNNKSITGLTDTVNNHFKGEGPGRNFSKSVVLYANENYYLVVDNVYDGGKGFRMIFKKTNCHQPLSTREELLPEVVIKTVDKETGRSLSARVLIIKDDYENEDTLLNTEGLIVSKKLPVNQYFILYARAKNYFSYKEEFRLYDKDTLVVKEIKLQPVEVGKKIEIENIYFLGGRADILRKSYPALKNLLFVLKDNPSLKIEIQGHVNQPYNTRKKHKEKYYRELSVARAKAVYDYLVKRGIDPSRLSYRGFGYSKMKFPYAATPEEMQQNRRVEVEIMQM